MSDVFIIWNIIPSYVNYTKYLFIFIFISTIIYCEHEQIGFVIFLLDMPKRADWKSINYFACI